MRNNLENPSLGKLPLSVKYFSLSVGLILTGVLIVYANLNFNWGSHSSVLWATVFLWLMFLASLIFLFTGLITALKSKEKYKGLGVGLNLVGILAYVGGFIAFYSR